MVCDNEFCQSHVTNNPGGCSGWNKTQCALYEIDPYQKGTNESGIRTDTCEARLKFHRMWMVDQQHQKKMERRHRRCQVNRPL